MGVLVAGSGVNVAVGCWGAGVGGLSMPGGADVGVKRPAKASGVFVSIDTCGVAVRSFPSPPLIPSPSTVGLEFASGDSVPVTSAVTKGDCRAISVPLTTGLAVKSTVGA